MPFLLAEILNFQGSAHLIGVGSLSELLYMDTPEIMTLVENLLSYALIRDEYREICKRKREFDK